jgi:serine/threonine-protein kinase
VLLAGPKGSSLNAVIPKITDFGLAKKLQEAATSLTMSGMILGTPNYISPEQAGGQNDRIGPATDIHALGMMLYELAPGQLPFRAGSTIDLLIQIRNQEAPPPRTIKPELPRDLERIILRCLMKRPEQRYASARELAEELERFLMSGRALPGAPPSAAMHLETKPRRAGWRGWWPFGST